MNDKIKAYIREVPDFPKPGILFYDITTLVASPDGFKITLDAMEEYVRSKNPTKLLGVESRGFVFGAALSDRIGVSLVLARKPGKLPAATVAEEYELEYGTDKLEVHADAITSGDRVIVVDDLIATGGTLLACCKLVEKLGGEVVGISSVVALDFLPYAEKLSGYDVNYLVAYDSEKA